MLIEETRYLLLSGLSIVRHGSCPNQILSWRCLLGWLQFLVLRCLVGCLARLIRLVRARRRLWQRSLGLHDDFIVDFLEENGQLLYQGGVALEEIPELALELEGRRQALLVVKDNVDKSVVLLHRGRLFDLFVETAHYAGLNCRLEKKTGGSDKKSNNSPS